MGKCIGSVALWWVAVCTLSHAWADTLVNAAADPQETAVPPTPAVLVQQDESGAYAPVYVSPHTGIPYQNGYGFLKKTKYGPRDAHFDYVNPNAPKGGVYRFASMGSWDSLNPIPLRGSVAMGSFFWVKDWRYLLDAMLRPSLDEPASYYGLIAQGVAVGVDGDWVAFKLRDAARFHDGHPITVEDVLWTFAAASAPEANPRISQPLEPFSHGEEIAPGEVKFYIKPEYHGDPYLPIRIGDMPILPKHYWEGRDIYKTTVEAPLGSGVYRIKRFSVGRWIEWERVPDYWAEDLAPNVGHFNFDLLRTEYFRDDQMQTEAVKAHVIDAHIESVPRAWHASYDTPAMRAGKLQRLVYKWLRPAGMWWPMFWNLEQERFQDIRVREALWLLGDYRWGAKRSYNFFGAAESFFTGSELAATGLPSALELKFLEPLRGQIPDKVFTHPPEMPPGDGRGYNREHVLRAARLLEEAGWVVRDNRLVNATSGEPFELRFLAVSAALGRGLVPYTRRAARLGIKSAISAPEISNWQYRMRSGDFDVGAIWFLPEIPPNTLIHTQFHSSGADMAYSYNWSNLKDPAVDQLIHAVQAATSWDEYVAACRAFDRVMLWNHYFVPSGSKTQQAMAFWDKFGRPPDQAPLNRQPQVPTWWYDEQKAAAVLEFVGDH